MSIKVMDMVWQNATDLKGNDLLVMLALADWSNDEGLCWPSVPSLAMKARVSERTVRYALRDLLARGYIQIDEQRGRFHTNHYLLNLQVLGGRKLHLLQVMPDENLQNTPQNLQNATVKPAIAIAAKPSVNHQLKPSTNIEPPAKKKKGEVPTEFPITPELETWAKEAGFRGDLAHLRNVTAAFLDHHASNGNKAGIVDWKRAWQKWIRNSVTYGQDLPNAQNKGHPKNNGGIKGTMSDPEVMAKYTTGQYAHRFRPATKT